MIKSIFQNMLLALVLLSICGCDTQNQGQLPDYDYSLQEGKLDFILDGDSVGKSTKFQSFVQAESQVEYLAFLNQINSTIKVYDLDSLTGPVKTIAFETKQGPNSIGGRLSYFEVLNEDSILTYVDFTGGLMTLTDWEGNKLDAYQLPIRELLETNYFPGFNTASPIFQVSKEELLFPYSVSKSNSTGKSPLFKFNMKSGTVEFGLEDLRFYEELDAEKIGGKELFKSSLTYNPEQNVYALIRPLDHRVFTFSGDMTLLKTYDLRDSEFKTFKTLERPRGEYRTDDKKYLYHRYGNSHYTSIIYDRWKDVYYRILLLGYEKKEIERIVEEGVVAYSSFKISVFDNGFNKILDQVIDGSENLSHDEVFVSSKGLALKILSNEGEDMMSFKTFSLTKK